MRALAAPVPCERRPRRHCGHRRRAPDLQRVDHRGADRRRRRLRAGQARQPLGDRAVGQRRRPRGAGRAHRPRSGRRGAVHRRGRVRLHVRSGPPPGDALRRPGAQGAGRAHDLQLPGPADQPGGARRQLIMVSDPAFVRMAGAGAAGRRSRVGSVQRGWSRRDEHLGPDARGRGQRGRDRALRRRTAGRRARHDDTRRRGRRPPGGQRGDDARDPGRRARPAARPCPAQRGCRHLRRRRGRQPEDGTRPPARRSTRCRPAHHRGLPLHLPTARHESVPRAHRRTPRARTWPAADGRAAVRARAAGAGSREDRRVLPRR
jgi:hypothetical protein